MTRKLTAAVSLALVVSSAACGGGGGGGSATPQPTGPTPPTTPTVIALFLVGAGCLNDICSGQAGNSLQLTATAQLSDNTTPNVTSQAQWSSSNSSVATVSSGGLVTFRAAGDADILATYQGKLAGLTMRLTPAGPRTSFGNGRYLVGTDIAAGRYFTDPTSSCYWERLSGLGGTLGEILANDFVGFDAGQSIVDIRSSDRAFSTNTGCGTWTQTPRGGLQTSIAPGTWLVGAQVAAGTYRASAASGCYWERVRNFDGTLSAIIANDFVSGAGQQLVTINAGDAGFHTNASCGTWTRTTLATTDTGLSLQSSQSIESNWRAGRARR